MHVVAGLALAFTTAILYASAIGLQALEAREAPEEEHLRVALLRRLVTRPRWLIGTFLALCGWAAQVGALLLIPLTLVEPVLATSLIVLLGIGARVLGERVGRREILSVCTMAAGIALLAWAAPPRETNHTGGAALIVSIAVLAVIALVPYALARLGRPAGLLIAVGAGSAYALDGLGTKFFSDDFANRAWVGLIGWGIVMGVAAGVATLSEMSALQRRPATQVAPIVLALTTLIPVGLAPVFAGETWSGDPWLRVALGVSIILIVGGASVLATSPAVGAVLEEPGKGTERSDERESTLSARSTSSSDVESDESSSVSTTTSPALGTRSGSGSPASK
jgi:drug/metabolite transporter (DMT)-like permease